MDVFKSFTTHFTIHETDKQVSSYVSVKFEEKKTKNKTVKYLTWIGQVRILEYIIKSKTHSSFQSVWSIEVQCDLGYIVCVNGVDLSECTHVHTFPDVRARAHDLDVFRFRISRISNFQIFGFQISDQTVRSIDRDVWVNHGP